MTLFEKALVELRVERGEIVDNAALLKFNEHDKEVIRLAELLHYHRHEDLNIQSCVAIVYDLLSAYQPRVEWADKDHGRGDFGSEVWGRMITATAQIGGRQFSYKGRIDERAGDAEVEHFKVHILRRLGSAVGLWMNGQPVPPDGEGGQRRIAN